MLLLEKIFQIINDSGLDYCVQNKYEMMPEEIPSDIDMMYRNACEEDLDRIVFDAAKCSGLLITQKIVQDFGEFTYILSYPSPNSFFQLQLDFYRVISKGKIHNALLAEHLLENKRIYRGMYIPGRYEEIRYIVVRRTLKNDFSQQHLSKMVSLYSNDMDRLKNDFGIMAGEVITEAIEKNDLRILLNNYDVLLESIKSMSKKNYSLSNKLKRFSFILFNYPSKRVFHKCGISVAFLSPDGTGKSSIINGISQTCSGSFYGVQRYYFRPHLFKNIGHYNKLNPSEEARSNNDPHNVVIDGKTKSMIRFLFYNLDFILGTIIKVDVDKMKKKLVIFDRYYYDYFADMKRYRYSLSKKWALVFRFFIPKPNLIIVLDAPSNVIFKRKQELDEIEIERQRKEFAKIKTLYSNVITIDTNDDIEKVIPRVTQCILEHQAQNTLKIMKIKRG